MQPDSLQLPNPAFEEQSSGAPHSGGKAEPEPRDATFFYLGKAPAQGQVLIDAFHSGFFTLDFDRGIALLQQTMASRSLPVVIFLNGTLGVETIREFYNKLPSSVKQTAPVLIDATKLEPEEKAAYARLGFVSELISLKDISPARLLSMALFIWKTKSLSSRISLETRRLPTFLRSVESREVAKRLIDIVISAIAIIALSPVFLVIAIAIMVESGGPVLYVSPRAGRGYRIFNFLKFRTMVPSEEDSLGKVSHLNQYGADPSKRPPFFKATNDPRITKVGAILRSTSLDELPQFFNVLFGDMSLVGNRPLPLYEAETLTSDEFAVRFLAPAGITGLWQIKKRGSQDMSAEERLNLDIAYAHNNNLMYDFWIMANTPSALIQKPNA